MAFITLLATAVGIVSALGLVIVGLVEAPWQVLLLGLLAALYALQRQIQASELVAQASDIVPPEAIAADAPLDKPNPAGTAESTPGEEAEAAVEAGDAGYELTYRGIRYRSSHPSPGASATAKPEGDAAETTEGIYRGQRWQR
ncbi:hypothetical protein IQ265_19150 [Nodosilinea sp. LEGE 06152]|uniref:DUF4278 domain-containing protein n=1 Tax=Nodosilinea sp. LEGE 06152 TaxID=2777966 RepID=UPI00187DE579|nr:DUF4278 domain-containing protein [Nodosilinea sp. LEGE 06152]MBE9158935.1 hypothetical protein [Nodosilinea sp. LEGE 06152]